MNYSEEMNRQKKFYELLRTFDDDTRFLSFHNTNHPAFLELVEMGKSIMPLLLSNLWEGWLPLLALSHILKEMPFSLEEDDIGNFDKLSEKWFLWGKENKLI